MKKIALVLAVVVALTACLFALSACGDKEETSSAAESKAESAAESKAESKEESKAESKEESKEEPSSEEPAESSEEPAESSEEPAESSEEPAEPTGDYSTDVDSVSGTNIAEGCTYTGAETYSGQDTYSGRLTDGVVPAELCYDNTWFAYWYNAKDAEVENKTNAPGGKGVIVLDLGSVKDVKVIRLLTMLGNTSGITAPKSITFEISEDGKTYSNLGTQTFLLPDGESEDASKIGWVGYDLGTAQKAQYVRVTLELEGTCWSFLSELEVY